MLSVTCLNADYRYAECRGVCALINRHLSYSHFVWSHCHFTYWHLIYCHFINRHLVYIHFLLVGLIYSHYADIASLASGSWISLNVSVAMVKCFCHCNTQPVSSYNLNDSCVYITSWDVFRPNDILPCRQSHNSVSDTDINLIFFYNLNVLCVHL